MFHTDFLKKIKKPKNPFTKGLYIGGGSLLVFIGILGLIFPILPGFMAIIPGFYLLTSGSQKINRWAKKNKYFSKYMTENEY